MPKLSQVFLKDKNILKKLVDASSVREGELILEVGPGRGDLTKVLLERGAKVIGVELDRGLIELLKREYALLINERLFLKWGDFLKLKTLDILREFGLKPPLKFISNIPYAITTPIIEKVAREKGLFSEVYMTIQKEVGLRLVAKPATENYGALTLFVNYHFEPEILFDIKRKSFRPVPKVDSVFVKLTPRRTPPFHVNEKIFFKIVRASFLMRRKKLRSVLKRTFKEIPIETVERDSGVSLDRRGETLSMEEFKMIADSVEKCMGNLNEEKNF